MTAKQIASATTAQQKVLDAEAAADEREIAHWNNGTRGAESEATGPVSAKPTGFAVHGKETCPSCGIHLHNGVGIHGDDVNGKRVRHDKFQFVCLGCGEEFGPAIRTQASSAVRSEGIAASWNDPEIRAKRSERTAVQVTGPKGSCGDFASVSKAFLALGLPMHKHIKFRMELKAAGTHEIGGFVFAIVAK